MEGCNMTYTDFNDAGAHLGKAAWKYAQDLVAQGFPGDYAIQEAEGIDRVLKQNTNTKEVIFEKRSA
jgi:hypothetical protein